METPEKEVQEEKPQDSKPQELHQMFGSLAEHNNLQGDFSANQIKTRHTIQKQIQSKRQLQFKVYLATLFLLTVISAGFSIFAHQYYSNLQFEIASFDHYSSILFNAEYHYLSLNNNLVGFETVLAGSFLPPYTSAPEFRNVVLSEVYQATTKVKEQMAILRKDNSMSQEVWLNILNLLDKSKVVQQGEEVSFERALHESIVQFVQLYTWEIQTNSLTTANSDYSFQIKSNTINKLKRRMLYSNLEQFRTKIDPSLKSLLESYSQNETSSNLGFTVSLAVFCLILFAAILLIDLEFMKKLDRLVRLFYGFKTQDCQEITRRCERLMDKIQAAQFNSDEEFMGVNDNEYVKSSVLEQDPDAVDQANRKRKGKGSLVKIVTSRMVLVLFFIICNFFFKFYGILSRKQALDDFTKIYYIGLDFDRFNYLLSASDALIVKACLEPDINLNKSKELMDITFKVWEELQKVGFFLSYLILSNI